VTEPIFWLVCSLLLVTVCLTAVLMAAIPALRELARASRSAERLFDTLYRELPPTLESIRLTGSEISDLTDDLSEGVESAGNVVKQVDQGLRVAQRQVKEAGVLTQSVWTGVQVAWKTLTKPSKKLKPRRTRSAAQTSDDSASQTSKGNTNLSKVRPAPTLQPPPSTDVPGPSSVPLTPSTQSNPQNGAAYAVEQRLAREVENPSASEQD
jgi:hypothetical protein